MNLKLDKSELQFASISISGSKSETNRSLLLQALFPELQIENASNSDDSEIMQKALQDFQFSTNFQHIDVHHAGTAMRFLTAFFAIQEGKEVVLTGSKRMQERPVKILVDALNRLGAEITYEEKEGFPPIRIKGKKDFKSSVTISANVSSQYISALLLIAPKLENGLELTLEGEITSGSYIKMTLALLNEIGIQTSFIGNKIKVSPCKSISTSKISIESDWSSASYWYSLIALSRIGSQVTLSNFKENSLQGDSILVEIYKDFGVETIFNKNNFITITKVKKSVIAAVDYQLVNAPDIAQTIAVTCFGLGIGCSLFGLHTLKIKETDRLEALKNELTKLGASVFITNDSFHLEKASKIKSDKSIVTYQDHRMAMAFAPLALRVPIEIQEAEVVSKSYPNFWDDLRVVGVKL